MRWSDAKGRKVVSTSDAATVGKVSDVVVDAASGRVVAVLLKKTSGDGDTLLWPDIASFGVDAVTVEGEQAVSVAGEPVTTLRHKDRAVLGKRVLTTDGDELGKVKDLDFDAETGRLNALVVGGAEVSATRLLDAGAYAVVVRG
jgi:sporulation protein YlmC with PRC-barrel domain